MASKNIDLGYKPRSWQTRFHLGCKGKSHACCIVARQHGKTELAIMELIDRSLKGPENTNWGYVCPFQSQTRKIMWPRLKTKLSPLGQHASFRETDMIATLPGNRKIYGLGGDNEAARGHSFRGLVIDEFDELSQEVFRSVLIPTTASYEDPFMLFIGTLARSSKLWRLYEERLEDPDWYCQVTKASDAGILTEKQLERYRLEMGDNAYLREFECDPHSPVEHAVLGSLLSAAELEGRVVDSLSCNPLSDLHFSWDLGIRDHTTIWAFQLIGSHVHIVDYDEFSGIGLVEIIRRLQKKYASYEIGTNVLPHDINVRDYSTGISRLSTFHDMEFGDPYPLMRMKVEDTLNACRLNIPRMIIKKTKGLTRLKAARYEVDNKTDTILDKIAHDDNSHALDAFRYLCSWVEQRYPTGKSAGDVFKKRRWDWKEPVAQGAVYA